MYSNIGIYIYEYSFINHLAFIVYFFENGNLGIAISCTPSFLAENQQK